MKTLHMMGCFWFFFFCLHMCANYCLKVISEKLKIFIYERSSLSRFHFQRQFTRSIHATLCILMVDIEKDIKIFPSWLFVSYLSLFSQFLLTASYYSWLFLEWIEEVLLFLWITSVSQFCLLYIMIKKLFRNSETLVNQSKQIMLYKKWGKC